MTLTRHFTATAILALGVGLGAGASAQDLVYKPVNPSFGGNPLNSSHLLGLANAQRSATARDAEDRTSSFTDPTTPGSSDADLFVRQLQGRLLSALAAQVTDAIFGTDPQDSGTVTFGSTTITFERTIDAIRLEIVDNLEGTVTEIVVPQLVTDVATN
ncbi:curli production assembly/transport component CsgF [Salinihabitans flavidus]|uniref:Curli production assembly/transport component CsgF n=1 Tax=Salinihabitans flavidus TaxID=569882 RepID=A0A1H8VEC0_9RHOB|nr:curli assembly protein CsgF [Salinihabitans flavidus]SEP13701.1 curli production assembly/transport component CsgF [Salinihabitans flavidus]